MKIHYLKFSIWLCKIQDYNFRILSSRRAALGRPPDGDWRRTKVAQSVYISLQRHCADSRRLETRGTQAEAETRGHLSAGFNHYKPRNVPGLLSRSRSRILQSEDWGWDGGSHPSKPGSVAVSRKLVTVNTFASITSSLLRPCFKCDKALKTGV